MRNFTKLACCAATLAVVLGVATRAEAGKPDKPGGDQPKTQACVLSGDATGGGQVGIDAKSYGPLAMTVVSGGQLELLFGAGGFGPNGAYSGLGRVLKNQGRLDFYFDSPASVCRPADWGDEPGPGTGICRYRLILLNGVFAQKAERVEFTATGGAGGLLYDNWGVVYGYDPLISSGTANLQVQFQD